MKNERSGYTILEVLVASAISVIVISAVVGFGIFTQRTWQAERVKSELYGDLQIAMEWMKKELMFSDSNKVTVAQGGISFPKAMDDDGDGYIELDPDGKIQWDQTVVYHVYNSGDFYELRKTVFPSWNEDIDHEGQLNNVINSGGGDPSSTTRTIVPGLEELSLDVSSLLHKYDGYNSEVEKSENVGFGSIYLEPGYHTIEFEIVGKNEASTGYGLGIDAFSITPSGHPREAEDYILLVHLDGSAGISDSSGDTITKENMISYGAWGGNYQLDYGSNNIGDDITLRFYYDLWRETDFSQGSLDNVVVKFSNENGAGGGSGNSDYILSLEGNESEMTEGTKQSKSIIPGDGDNTTYRVIISSPSNGRLCSIRFSAGTSASLTIEEAYISERESGQDGGTCYPITFNNCDIDPRNSGQGVTPYNGGGGITIPVNRFGWSNWIDLGENIDSSKEYFVTFYIRGLTEGESMSIAYWQGDSTRSYTRTGDCAGTEPEAEDWGTDGTEDNNYYGIEEVWVRYVDQGTYTSKIYDTGMDNPLFDKIVWSIKRNNSPDANLLLKVRSSDSYDTLANDSDWADEFTVDTNSTTSGNVSISSIAGGRYVQFQAEFYSYESDEDSLHQTNDTDDEYDNDEDYDMSCILQDVTITWPGQARIVDVSGYYTLKPGYGEFIIKIDGEPLTKGLQLKLTATRTAYSGRDITASHSIELECRNTNR